MRRVTGVGGLDDECSNRVVNIHFLILNKNYVLFNKKVKDNEFSRSGKSEFLNLLNYVDSAKVNWGKRI